MSNAETNPNDEAGKEGKGRPLRSLVIPASSLFACHAEAE
jgi:hypothetical protein